MKVKTLRKKLYNEFYSDPPPKADSIKFYDWLVDKKLTKTPYGDPVWLVFSISEELYNEFKLRFL